MGLLQWLSGGNLLAMLESGFVLGQEDSYGEGKWLPTAIELMCLLEHLKNVFSQFHRHRTSAGPEKEIGWNRPMEFMALYNFCSLLSISLYSSLLT